MAKKSIITQLKGMGIKLNQEQRQAVEDLTGVSIINAGAGSGKTTAIVAKLMYSQLQVPDSYALAISFTKKAVYELQSRLTNVSNVTCTTFHSFFWRILRSNGYKHFRIVENEGQRNEIINQVIADNKLQDVITSQEFIENFAKHRFSTVPMQVMKEAYLEELKNRHIVCFDGILYFVYELLLAKPSAVHRIRNMYDYIMIDECQDLSTLQAAIITLIWNDVSYNITMVGDPNQSIYSFRGSKPNVMEELQNFYRAKVFNLTTNYRSSSAVLTVANTVLPQAQRLVPARKSVGITPAFQTFAKPKDEANYVCAEIKRLHNDGKKLSDIAILFRSSPAISEVFEALVEAQIPVVKLGSDCTKWFNSRYRKIIALLNFAYGTENNHYLKCVLPIFGIPQSAIDETYFENSPSLKDVLLQNPAISKSQKAKLQQFFSLDVTEVTMQELAKQLWDLLLKEHYGATDNQVIEEFCEAISKFETFVDLRLYLSKIRLIAKQMERLANDATADYVRLLSIHTSKGMEFDTVFVVGATDGILPDTSHETTNMAEENRLAYVAVTRAKERLYVSYAQSGIKEDTQPSRFFAQYFATDRP